MKFDIFDESLGVDGYYNLIRKEMFPNSTELSFDICRFQMEERYYPKRTCFSRVRKLTDNKHQMFLDGNVDITEFYPPNPDKKYIPEGRFNKEKNATMYLADHPFVAMMECDVAVGDFFLLSYFSLPKNMCFIHLEDNGDKVSTLLFKLFKSTDKRFYPVIDLVYSNHVKFDNHDGIAYESTKVDVASLEINNFWCSMPPNANINFAIQNKDIEKFNLEVSWLMYCGENFNPEQMSIYIPFNDGGVNSISKLNYKGNEKEFVKKTNEINDRLHENQVKLKSLLDRGDVKTSGSEPFKIIRK